MTITAYIVAILCLGFGYFLGLADGLNRIKEKPKIRRVNLRHVRPESPAKYTNTRAIPLETFTTNEPESVK